MSECSTRYVYDSAQPSPVEWQDIDPVLPVGLANQGSAAHRGYFRLPDTNTGVTAARWRGQAVSHSQATNVSALAAGISYYPSLLPAKLSRSPHIWRPPQYERSGGSTRVKVRGQISNSRRIFRLGPLPQHFTLNLESAFSLQIIFKHGWKCAKMQIL